VTCSTKSSRVPLSSASGSQAGGGMGGVRQPCFPALLFSSGSVVVRLSLAVARKIRIAHQAASAALSKAVEDLLAVALERAAVAQRWDIVAQLARELEARRALSSGRREVAT
jgi:hypothetical protein